MLNPLQERLLTMLGWLHNFCVQNNITYYICSGTMLGAARHKGFIPWDDDIDVLVPRPDYERLCKLLSSAVDNYIIETPYSPAPDYIYSFAKLYDTETTMIERKKIDIKRGVYIDVFPLDGLGRTKEESFRNYKKIDFLNMLLATRTCALRKDRKLFKNAAIVVSRIIPEFIINTKKLAQKLDKASASFGYDENLYVTNCMSTYRDREIMEKRIFGTPKKYQFENIEVFGPEYYDEFLTHLYGNWRELPPKDKRKSAHDFVYLDLEKSYLTD